MTDRFVAGVWAIAVAVLDFWLDQKIKRANWPAATKERAKLLEDELVRVIQSPIVKELMRKLAGPMVARALARAFPNDPNTWKWAG